MAFEDGSQGYRPELTFGGEYLPARRETTTYEVSSVPALTSSATAVADADPTLGLGIRAASPNLEYVFDDPADGEPGRDRMIVHGLWELVLALALAGAGYLLYSADASAFNPDGLRHILIGTTIVGLVAAGFAASLRAGVPNLAVGAIAVLASVYVGQHVGGGLQSAILVMVGICAAIGLVQGLVVVGLQVPAWAASLGVGLGLLAWLVTQRPVSVNDGYDPGPHAYYWFGGFCAVSLIGSVVGLVPQLRRAVGRFRPVADPARRRGVVAALIALGATVISAILAGTGGLLSLLVTNQSVGAAGGVEEWTALAVGAALLGGTSAFGRRGGIFGTIFAAGLLAVGLAYVSTTNRNWSTLAFGAVAIGLGLAVTRLVERFGRPSVAPRPADQDDWTPRVHSLTPAARTWPTPSTSTTTTSGGLWSGEDAWGSIETR